MRVFFFFDLFILFFGPPVWCGGPDVIATIKPKTPSGVVGGGGSSPEGESLPPLAAVSLAS